jgi:3-oxochol-4-en-24-oyl-CoA dehydrogenase
MTTDPEFLAELRSTVRDVLTKHESAAVHRRLLHSQGAFDCALWAQAGQLGWCSLTASEHHGGMALGDDALCVVAEECGRSVANIPLLSNAIVIHALGRWGSPDVQAAWIPDLASGAQIGAFGFAASGQWGVSSTPALSFNDGKVTGTLALVPYGAVADVLITPVRHGDDMRLVCIDLRAASVQRALVNTVDNARANAALTFLATPAQLLATSDPLALLCYGAVLTAFEQVGGATTCLEQASAYARTRYVFGQPIGRFQAIKHRLADIYCKIEVARGAALRAIAAPDQIARPAAARLGGSDAYDFAAREAMHVHGGIGVTWDMDCHLHYRRARTLSLELGASMWWRDQLINALRAKPSATDAELASSAEATTSTHLADYREKARLWLAQHAPGFSGKNRKRHDFEADLALGKAWQALKADHGYAAITLPKIYGGGGASEIEQLIFTEEELKYDVPYDYHAVSLGMPVPIMERHATEEQKQRYLPAAIRGEDIWCQLFSEPSAGSDLAALRLQAKLDDKGDWVLNGQKLWTSWAHVAQFAIIIARSDPTVAKHAGLTFFFLDMRSPGIQARPIERMGGDRDVCEVFFDNVHIPDTQRLGKIGEGFRLALETLMIERYSVSDESSGGPSLSQLITFADVTQSDGASTLDNDMVRTLIADAYVELEGLRSIHERAMAAIATGEEPGPEGAIRKLLVANQRQRLMALAMDMAGPCGLLIPQGATFADNFALSWLDTPALRIAGGTDEILRNTIAERVLGLPQDHRPDKGIPFNQIPTS